MDSEGYPTEMELNRIENWDIKDFPELLNYIEDLHIYKNYINRKVIKEWYRKNTPILEWTFSTGGWSGNESLMYALLETWMFKSLWYHSWQRGGRYVFHIDPRQVGYKLVKDYCKENDVSRQYVHQSMNKFDRFELTRNKVFIRLKNSL